MLCEKLSQKKQLQKSSVFEHRNYCTSR